MELGAVVLVVRESALLAMRDRGFTYTWERAVTVCHGGGAGLGGDAALPGIAGAACARAAQAAKPAAVQLGRVMLNAIDSECAGH